MVSAYLYGALLVMCHWDARGSLRSSSEATVVERTLRLQSILDTFEASIANLEAQLELREKQYEYYRNKLLTFE